MSRQEAARLAAVLPLPKGRDAIAPRGFTRRYGNSIAARIGVVARDRLDACIYRGVTPPRDRTPPPSRQPQTLPGEDVETSAPPPPPPPEVLEALPEAPPAEPLPIPQQEPAAGSPPEVATDDDLGPELEPLPETNNAP
jgi:monofunctional biosynthetic peptidoglycan transglycosylase